MRNISEDITIISGDNGEIQSNKYTLSIFCPTLTPIFSTSPTFFLPECSTFSIKYLLNIITNGFAVTEKLSNEYVNEIIETAQVLSIEMRELCQDVTVPSLLKTNKLPTIYQPKKSVNDVYEKRDDENSGSIIDVMDSWTKIFYSDYKDEENSFIEESFAMSNEPKVVEPKAKKREINDISRNDKGKYQCPQCDYENKRSDKLKRHVETVHEGVRYPCNKCDYKSTTDFNLRKHQESKHEGVCYSCDQCKYRATTVGNLQKHVKAIHEGVRHPCGQCDYKATTTGSLKRHVKSIHDVICNVNS